MLNPVGSEHPLYLPLDTAAFVQLASGRRAK
jgi:hypothetical protein